MLATETVQRWMTSPAVNISPAWSVRRAHSLMQELGIRHLPVVADLKLVGIVTLSDILEAEPSDATSLSAWELNFLWDKLTVEQIMTRKVVTTRPDALIVETVQTMFDQKFSGLPVVDAEGHLVGMLSQIDIYRMVLKLSEATLPV